MEEPCPEPLWHEQGALAQWYPKKNGFRILRELVPWSPRPRQAQAEAPAPLRILSTSYKQALGIRKEGSLHLGEPHSFLPGPRPKTQGVSALCPTAAHAEGLLRSESPHTCRAGGAGGGPGLGQLDVFSGRRAPVPGSQGVPNPPGAEMGRDSWSLEGTATSPHGQHRARALGHDCLRGTWQGHTA